LDILKEVQNVLELDLPKEVTNTLNKLAGEYVKLSNRGGASLSEDIIPDIDALRYQAGLSDVVVTEGNSIENVRTNLQEYLINRHSEKFLNITSDKIARQAVEKEIVSYCTDNLIQLKGMDRKETIDFLIKDILDFGVITKPIFETDEDVESENSRIEEIRVNDWDDIRFVVDGVEYETSLKFESPDQVMAIAQKMCRNYKADMVKPDRPFVRLRMGNSIRVSIMGSPVARRPDDINGTVLQMTIRKQSSKPFSKDFLFKNNTLDEYTYDLINLPIQNGISTAFYGGTNSGKTALLTSFAHNIDNKKRIISAAEIDEMNLRKIDPVTKKALNSVLMWEIKPEKGMDFRKLVNSSLTFTPEVIILQEMKGPEAVDIVESSITDHQILTSLHAKNKIVFGDRILTMYKQSGSDLTEDLILNQVIQAFPFIVRTKLYKDGKRRVAEVGELIGYDRTTGQFEVRTLVEYTVQDTKKVIGYNEYLKKDMVKWVVTGSFKVRNFYSEKLVKEMLNNGTPREEIDRLETEFKMRKERGD